MNTSAPEMGRARKSEVILTKFGGEISPTLQSANDLFVTTFLDMVSAHDGDARLVGLTTVVPTEKGRHTFWKKPPQSLTVVVFAASDAESVTQNSPERTDQQWQHIMARRVLQQVQKGGILKNALDTNDLRKEHHDQHLTKIQGLSFKDGQKETRAILIERRLPGHILDRIIVIPEHKEEDAKQTLEAMNNFVTEGMGKGQPIKDTTLAELIDRQSQESWIKKQRIFSKETVKTIYHAAQNILRKRKS